MIKNVRKREMPTKTVFGGVCAVPIACLSRDMTIIMRTNDVIIMSSEGNSVSTVIRIKICRVRLYSVPSGV
jgi:hypothetical protein